MHGKAIKFETLKNLYIYIYIYIDYVKHKEQIRDEQCLRSKARTIQATIFHSLCFRFCLNVIIQRTI